MTNAQRARRIRQINARIEALEAEAKALRTSLLPLEAEESWSLGYRCIVRGEKLLAAMDRRDAEQVAA